MYNRSVKRVIDIVVSIVGLIITLPIMAVIAIVIFLEDPGPVFFRQKRVGKGKQLFKIIKFRTMKLSTPHDTPTHLLENPKQYLLKSGRLLRRFSMDEIPQLINVLLNDMSLVGPRPALWNQYDLIAERDKYGANDVHPGVTGWAQINGRDELPIDVKASFDGAYVQNMSFRFDCKCFFGTFGKVLKHEGVVEGGTGPVKIKRS